MPIILSLLLWSTHRIEDISGWFFYTRFHYLFQIVQMLPRARIRFEFHQFYWLDGRAVLRGVGGGVIVFPYPFARIWRDAHEPDMHESSWHGPHSWGCSRNLHDILNDPWWHWSGKHFDCGKTYCSIFHRAVAISLCILYSPRTYLFQPDYNSHISWLVLTSPVLSLSLLRAYNGR